LCIRFTYSIVKYLFMEWYYLCMIIEFVVSNPVLVTFVLLFVLELYLRKSGTKYDTQVKLVKDSLLYVFSMVYNRSEYVKDKGESVSGDSESDGSE